MHLQKRGGTWEEARPKLETRLGEKKGAGVASLLLRALPGRIARKKNIEDERKSGEQTVRGDGKKPGVLKGVQ